MCNCREGKRSIWAVIQIVIAATIKPVITVVKTVVIAIVVGSGRNVCKIKSCWSGERARTRALILQYVYLSFQCIHLHHPLPIPITLRAYVPTVIIKPPLCKMQSPSPTTSHYLRSPAPKPRASVSVSPPCNQ